MTTLDGHVIAVRDFILSAACTNCVRLLRRDPAFEALIANALSTRPAPEPQIGERVESTFGVFAALFWFVVGAGCFGLYAWLASWALGGVR